MPPRKPAIALLAAAAALTGVEAAATVAWKEPLTAAYSALRGDPLAGAADAILRAGPTPGERRALARIEGRAARLEFLARSFRRRASDGDALGRLRIPKLGISEPVGEGNGRRELRRGPAHDPRTPLPGSTSTVAIAAHRSAFGGPFRQIGRLHAGDRVILHMPYGTFTYAVEPSRVTGARGPLPAGRGLLVLSTSTPRLVGGDRLVVPARLVAARLVVDARTKRDGARLRGGPPGR